MQNTDNQSFVTSSCILSSRPSRKVICNSKSLFLFPMEPNVVCANIGNKKSRKALAFTFLFSAKGLLGFCKSCSDKFAKRSLGEHRKQKKYEGTAFTFLFSERVYKDSVNPVVPRNYLSSKTKFLSIIKLQINFFPGQMPDHTLYGICNP